MVERSLCMREVQGSMPCSSIYFLLCFSIYFFIDEEKLFSSNSTHKEKRHSSIPKKACKASAHTFFSRDVQMTDLNKK